MVGFPWGDNQEDTTDESSKNNLISEFRNYIMSKDNKFYSDFMNAVDVLEENPQEEQEFIAWFKKEILNPVLDEPLENWLSNSAGWGQFTHYPSLKTGKVKTQKERKTTGDKRKFTDVFAGGGTTEMKNQENIDFIQGKTLKDILNTKIVRRLSGLQHLREAENIEQDLTDEEIDILFDSSGDKYGGNNDPNIKAELIFEERLDREGVPNGKLGLSLNSLKDKELKNKSHILLQWPNFSDEPMDKELDTLGDIRVRELSDKLGQRLQLKQSIHNAEMDSFVIKDYDFSLPQEFVNKLTNPLSKRQLVQTKWDIGGKQLSSAEYEKLVTDKLYPKYEEQWKKNKKNLPYQEYFRQVKGKDGKTVDRPYKRKLTLDEYMAEEELNRRQTSAPVTAEILEVYSMAKKGKSALIPFTYKNNKWVKTETPEEWQLTGSASNPIKMELDDTAFDTLIMDISDEVRDKAKEWSALRPADRVRGCYVRVKIALQESTKESLAAQLADNYTRRQDPTKKDPEEEYSILRYVALHESIPEGASALDKEGDKYKYLIPDVKEVRKKLRQEWETSQRAKREEDRKNKKTKPKSSTATPTIRGDEDFSFGTAEAKGQFSLPDALEEKGYLPVSISQSEYNELSEQEKTYFTSQYQEFDYSRDQLEVYQAERAGDLFMTDEGESGMTQPKTGQKTYRVGTVDADDPNSSLESVNLVVNCYYSQKFEIPFETSKQKKGNTELIDTIDSYKAKIREILEETGPVQ